MERSTRTRLTVIVISWLVGTVISVESPRQCPPFCVCDVWYELERASCTGRHLYSIHTGAPDDVQALDLSDNVISSINDLEYANLGLTKLKYLNLSGNAISEIGLKAFKHLNELTVLDLSENHLYDILDELFSKNDNLRILKLSGNSFNSRVPKLRSHSMTELSLDSCRISHLPPDTFNGLTHIRRLDLSNNLMIQMSSAVLQTLHFLKKLSLKGNPWSCNEPMYDLENLLKYKNIEFDEICSKKTRLKKFEKMIIRPMTRSQNYHPPVTVNENKSATANNSSNAVNNEDSLVVKKKENKMNVMKSVNGILAYFFLIAGFIVGAASGMLISYIWLRGNLFCCRRCRHREYLNDNSQRLSLLLNSWYLQDRTVSSADLTESCPGTPPPSYREVILRPNIYRCLSSQASIERE